MLLTLDVRLCAGTVLDEPAMEAVLAEAVFDELADEAVSGVAAVFGAAVVLVAAETLACCFGYVSDTVGARERKPPEEGCTLLEEGMTRARLSDLVVED